jgi:hypothetical protein
MKIITNGIYQSLELDYHLDAENIADCKFKENCLDFEILSLNKDSEQFMIFPPSETSNPIFVIDASFDETKSVISTFKTILNSDTSLNIKIQHIYSNDSDLLDFFVEDVIGRGNGSIEDAIKIYTTYLDNTFMYFDKWYKYQRNRKWYAEEREKQNKR